MKYIKSDLCQLGWLSCFGCCGNNFKEKKEIAKAITDNTLEFHRYKKQQRHIREWMDRERSLKSAGICRNLIYDCKNDSIHCPLHPEKNQGEDHRTDHPHCDILHVCKTAFFFDLWEDSRRQKFLRFLKEKKEAGEIDWHSYSIGMADDTLLEEFEGLKW